METYRGQWKIYQGQKMTVTREVVDCYYAPTSPVYRCGDGNFYQAIAIRPSAGEVELGLVPATDYPQLYENF